MLVNHLYYADDIYLINQSSAGMQQLLNFCDTYVKEHDLLFNGSKSYSILYVLNSNVPYLKGSVSTSNHLNIPTVNQSKYLGIIISENNCAPNLNTIKLYANYMLI